MTRFSSLSLIAVCSLCLAGAAGAQQPAPAPTTPAAPAPATAKKIPGLSDAGQAIYAKNFGTPDPQLLAIVRQQRALRSAMVALAMGAKVDVDKLADMLKQQDSLQSQFRQRQNEITVTMLRQLSDEDRGIYLRYSLTPPTPGTAAR